MVLNATDDAGHRAAILFDAAKNAVIPLGDETTDVVHAAGGKVLYLKGRGNDTELRIAKVETSRGVSMR